MGLQATANPVIKGVMVRGANVLPQKEIEEAFQNQFGRTLNFPQFSGALKRLNKWYEDRGIFGQVGVTVNSTISWHFFLPNLLLPGGSVSLDQYDSERRRHQEHYGCPAGDRCRRCQRRHQCPPV